jgi:hypothetical protein
LALVPSLALTLDMPAEAVKRFPAFTVSYINAPEKMSSVEALAEKWREGGELPKRVPVEARKLFGGFLQTLFPAEA